MLTMFDFVEHGGRHGGTQAPPCRLQSPQSRVAQMYIDVHRYEGTMGEYGKHLLRRRSDEPPIGGMTFF
jgi:hypothetical protein